MYTFTTFRTYVEVLFNNGWRVTYVPYTLQLYYIKTVGAMYHLYIPSHSPVSLSISGHGICRLTLHSGQYAIPLRSTIGAPHALHFMLPPLPPFLLRTRSHILSI